MPQLVVDLVIDAQQYQRLYSGSARTVSCRAIDGRRVQFPAQVLRPYVTRNGVCGRFLIQFTEDNRFESVSRLE